MGDPNSPRLAVPIEEPNEDFAPPTCEPIVAEARDSMRSNGVCDLRGPRRVRIANGAEAPNPIGPAARQAMTKQGSQTG
jgi:hypothetical protein